MIFCLSKHYIQILYENSNLGSKGQVLKLIYFMPQVFFYTPWKKKISSFLIFLGCIETSVVK